MGCCHKAVATFFEVHHSNGSPRYDGVAIHAQLQFLHRCLEAIFGVTVSDQQLFIEPQVCRFQYFILKLQQRSKVVVGVRRNALGLFHPFIITIIIK